MNTGHTPDSQAATLPLGDASDDTPQVTSLASETMLPPSTPVSDVIGDPAPAGPRIRWAGIIWGMVFIAVSGFGLLAVTNADVQQLIGDWWFGLTPTTLVATAVLVAGAIGLICAVVALARRGQHALARHRSAS